MKKLLLAFAGLALIGQSLFADISLSLGASSVSVEDESGTEFAIGLGTDNLKGQDSGIYWGQRLEFGKGTVGDYDSITYGATGKLGYIFTSDLSVYGAVAFAMQEINDIDCYGWAPGIGVNYKLHDSVTLNLEYMSYTLTPDENGYAGDDIDLDRATLRLAYNF